MFLGKGDNASRRGKSLLRFAAEAQPREKTGGTYVSLGAPEAPLTAAEIHRRARARRERVENAYLAELANRPEAPGQPSAAAPQTPRASRETMQPPRPPAPSVLDAFAKIDAAIANRRRYGPQRHQAEPAAAGTGSLFAAPGAVNSEAWRPLIDPRFIISAVKSWRTLIVGLGMLGAALGLMTALSTPKFFYASAEISIDPRGLKVIDNGVNPDGFVSDTFAIVDSQVRVMTSPEVLETVVKDLNLQDDTEFNGALTSGWLEAVRGIVFRQDAGSDKSLAAAEYLSDHVSVERGAKTYVVNVTAASADPVKAADIANKVVEVYVAKQRSQQSSTVQQTTNELTERLAALKQSVEESEQRVEAYKAENDLIGVDGRLIDDEAILRVNDQLSAARGQTINLNARAKSAKSLTPESVLDGGVTEEVNSPVLTGLRSQYSAAKQRRDGMATKLGPRHPERIQAESELESLRASIAAEIRRVSESMQADLRRAIQTEQDLAAHLAELKTKQGNAGGDLVKLRELQRDADANRSVYEAFLLRARQTGEQINLNTADIKLIVSARPPKEPLGTSRKLMVLGGLLGGLGLGLALAVLKGILDSIRSQMGGDSAAPAPAPAPDGGGGGMFRPRRAGEARYQAPEPAATPAAPLAQRLAEAFVPARGSAPAEQDRPAPVLPPQPEPRQPQTHYVQPAPLPQTHYVQPLPAPQQLPPAAAYWPPQPQMPHPGLVLPGPMMYPQQAFAPPAYPAPPAFAPLPPAMPLWPQPSPVYAFQQPAQLQMPQAQQPQFYAPPPPVPQPAAAAPRPAPHPFSQEAEPELQPASGSPVRAPAADRLSQIQESIDEFRSALTDLVGQRRAS
jgi:polysaccharide biosynthesis transport protein